MFVWSFRPIREFFAHIETASLSVKGYIFWPMFSSYEHSLACQTCGDRGHQYMMAIYEEPWHSHLLLSCHYLSLRLRSVAAAWDSNIQPSACQANALTDCVTAAGVSSIESISNLHANIGFLQQIKKGLEKIYVS